VLVALPLMVWGGVSLLRLRLFTCPRCRGAFFGPIFGAPKAAPPDLFFLWHCASCRVETGTARGAARGDAQGMGARAVVVAVMGALAAAACSSADNSCPVKPADRWWRLPAPKAVEQAGGITPGRLG